MNGRRKEEREKLFVPTPKEIFTYEGKESAERGKNQVPKSPPVYQEADSHLIALCIKEL